MGFEYVLKDYPFEICIDEGLTDPYSEVAHQAMRRLTSQLIEKYNNKKIGIFCSYDDIANLLQRECIIQGIRIPEKIEIIGYDNSPESDYAVYPITSIDQNIPLMAQIAIESLENYLPHESVVPATLVKKRTTQ